MHCDLSTAQCNRPIASWSSDLPIAQHYRPIAQIRRWLATESRLFCRIVDVQSVLFCGSFFVLLTSRHYLGLWKHRNKDSLDPRHFGTSAKVSGQFCPNAETLQTISLDTSVLRPGQCQRVQLLQFMAQHCWDSALIIFYRIHTSQATHMLAMCALRKI